MNLSKLRSNQYENLWRETNSKKKTVIHIPDDKPKPIHGLVLRIVASTQVDQTEDHAHEQEDSTATNVKDRVTDDQTAMATEHDGDFLQDRSTLHIDDARLSLVIKSLLVVRRTATVWFFLLPSLFMVMDKTG